MPKANEGTLKLKTKASKEDELENDKNNIADDAENEGEEQDDNDDAGAGEGDGGDDQGEGHGDIDEAKLRKLGWVPKDEWKGDPENWMDPKTFQQKRGDELSQLRRELRDSKLTMSELLERDKTREERAYNRALQDIEKRKRAAVKDGDEEAYDQAEADEAELKKDHQPTKTTKKQEAAPPPEVDEWIEENPWFNDDTELKAAAIAYHGTLGARHPQKPLRELLRMTGEHIKKIYPEKFQDDKGGQQKRRAPLESNRNNTIRTDPKKKKTAADLPPDAVEVGKRWIRQGLFKSLDEYAQDYFAD